MRKNQNRISPDIDVCAPTNFISLAVRRSLDLGLAAFLMSVDSPKLSSESDFFPPPFLFVIEALVVRELFSSLDVEGSSVFVRFLGVSDCGCERFLPPDVPWSAFFLLGILI